MIPPAHTGLPKDVSGTVLRIHENEDRYDILLDSGVMLTQIPINFMRPDNILCSGKEVKKSNGRMLLSDRKYKIPTYQRRYAWQKRDWYGLWNDIPKPNHSMGAINVYTEGDRKVVCDG